ncbi:MAG: 1,2-dihydroxy-3-keto-5-methylthiopentene dioxygenase [Planctomycetota bacterium]|nr:cupin domain-containing protein [Planctomycetota bacterium]
MAIVLVPDENRKIEGAEAIGAFLKPFGIWHERWDLEERVSPDAPAEDILSAYKPEIDRLKEAGGYITADVMQVSPATPNLDAMMEKFKSEHTHAEDEVRFILKGAGLFHIHPEGGPVFAIQVEAGDLINVPKGIRHWFNLCSDKTIRAIRLFQNPAGWTPVYENQPVSGRYQPLCFGPAYVASLPADGRLTV